MALPDIDLSRLPAPDFVETLSSENIYNRLKADFIARFPHLADALELESEPVNKELQMFAYRETLIRNRINKTALANLLATAEGADLDNIAAIIPLERKVLVEEDLTSNPPVVRVFESDDEFRRRFRLAPHAYSTGGARGAWIYHALSAHVDVKDADSVSPSPNNITVTALSRAGDGTPDQEVLDAIRAALSAEEARPQGDVVTVQAAPVVPYIIDATLTIGLGPDPSFVLSAVTDAVQKYADDQHMIGKNVRLSGLYKALMQEGVESVVLTYPTSDVIGAADPLVPASLGSAPFASSITITFAP